MKQTPHVSELFKEIIRNDNERDALRKQSVVPFDKGSALVREKREYRRAAEKALAWNTNKGNTA